MNLFDIFIFGSIVALLSNVIGSIAAYLIALLGAFAMLPIILASEIKEFFKKLLR